MSQSSSIQSPLLASEPSQGTQSSTMALGVLCTLSFSHLLNDTIQALIPAIYPLLKDSFQLNFTQIGLITFTFQMVGSVLQPLIGRYTDQHPMPQSLRLGMGVTLCGLVLLAFAPGYSWVLLAAGLVGVGSAVFHPESSRMARLASGGRHGFAQSLFQVGGNAGTALGPLLAAWIIIPNGQRHIVWFVALAALGMVLLSKVGRWYAHQISDAASRPKHSSKPRVVLSSRKVLLALAVLMILMFSKFFYLAAITNYYTFYLMHRFGLSVQSSQLYLFGFLAAGALGTFFGGPLGDRIGRRRVIWISILGIAPLSLLVPYASLSWTAILSIVIAPIMASAFPAILVYATELLPGKVGLIAGLFFGLAFGLAGIGSAVLGKLADLTSIEFVMSACSYLPLLGLFTWLLPEIEERKGRH